MKYLIMGSGPTGRPLLCKDRKSDALKAFVFLKKALPTKEFYILTIVESVEEAINALFAAEAVKHDNARPSSEPASSSIPEHDANGSVGNTG